MELTKISEMISELKDKKGKAFLTAVNTDVNEDELAEELLAIGECFGKAELLIQQAYVRAVRLSRKGVEFCELPTKSLGKGEPIGHPPIPSLSEPLPIGKSSGQVEPNVSAFKKAFKDMLSKIGKGEETMLSLDCPSKTVCTTCGVEGSHRLEPDGEDKCVTGSCNGIVKHWLGVITEMT